MWNKIKTCNEDNKVTAGEIFQPGVFADLSEDLYSVPSSDTERCPPPTPEHLISFPGLQKHPHPRDDKHRHRHIDINRNKSPSKIN